MRYVFSLLFVCFIFQSYAQKSPKQKWISIGARSTINTFNSEGLGLGTGGQFRIQLHEKINTEWFADFIVVDYDQGIQSNYIHIGWSMMFYPFNTSEKLIHPYILAGHCFDYNYKTKLHNLELNTERLSAALQAGIGTHLNITERVDLSLSTQYMFHVTEAAHIHQNLAGDNDHEHGGIESHLMTTLSANFKFFRI